jgi:replicative DNA helicase
MGTRKLKDIMDLIDVKLLVLDSLQSLPYISKQAPPDFVSRYETIMQQLKTLARYRKIPIIAIHTLSEGDSKEGALIDGLVYSLSDVFLHLSEKPPQGQEAATGVRELSLLVKKNRSGDRNIALKYAAQIYLQKFAEVK